MLKTLIYFPPEYRDLAHKIRENVSHKKGLFMGKPYADTDR